MKVKNLEISQDFFCGFTITFYLKAEKKSIHYVVTRWAMIALILHFKDTPVSGRVILGQKQLELLDFLTCEAFKNT
jgi:hypothetical protein